MLRILLLLSAKLPFIAAQVPMTGDMTVMGKMHVAVAAEAAQIRKAEVKAANVQKNSFHRMEVREQAARNGALIERGSLELEDGTVIEENVGLDEQIIDPRTPEGFGDPFFRKMHIEINIEAGLSPAMEEAISDEVSDVNITDDSSGDLMDFVDMDGDGYRDDVKDWSPFVMKNITYNSEQSSEVVDDVINRTYYYNGTWVDFVTSTKCLTTNGEELCTTEEFDFNKFHDEEVDLFPNGICPHPCDCIRSIARTKSAAEKLVEKCFDACSGNSLKDVFTCSTLKVQGARIKFKIEALIAEKAPGLGAGLKLKRTHPLGKEVKRFMGVF